MLEIQRTLDFGNARRIINLPDGVDPQEPATVSQLNAAIDGIDWKDSVLVASVGNVDINAPGPSIDSVVMSPGDRVLLKDQLTVSENGLYNWNGASNTMTRTSDANTANELETIIISVESGTSTGANFRQTQVNFTLNVDPITFVSFAAASPAATETTAGIAKIASQVQTNNGVDDTTIVTPLKLSEPIQSAKTIIPNPVIGLQATTTQEAAEDLQAGINNNKIISNLTTKWLNALQ